jgi:hypothetical protein
MCGECSSCRTMHGEMMLEDVPGMPIHEEPSYGPQPVPASPPSDALPPPPDTIKPSSRKVVEPAPLNPDNRRDSPPGAAAITPAPGAQPPGLIGPIGYDEEN